MYSTKDIKIPRLSKDWNEANSEKNKIIRLSLMPKPDIVTGIRLIIMISEKNKIALEKGIFKLRALDKI